MPRVAILDDYQNAAMDSADWSALPDSVQIEVFTDHQDEEAAVAERIKPFDIVLAMRERTPFTASLMEQLPNLKLLATTGPFNAAIDIEAATRLGIVVCGTGGRGRATCELTWALILGLMRDIPGEFQAVKEGRWQIGVGIDLDGATLGLVGLGHIGGQMAEVAKAFQMEIIAWSQNLTAERARECGATLVTKEELLDRADIVSIHLRLTDRTEGLIGMDDLIRMKPTATLINTSRGPIVDEEALARALNEGQIAGAGLDTFGVEPLPMNAPLRHAKNVLISPHIGYVTSGTYEVFYGDTVDNIRNFLKGQPSRVINTDVLGNLRQ